MKIEILGNTIEIGVGSSTGHPDYKGIQTCDLKEWVRVNGGDWFLIKYNDLNDLDTIKTRDMLALKLSAITGVDVFDHMGKLLLGNYETEYIRKLQ